MGTARKIKALDVMDVCGSRVVEIFGRCEVRAVLGRPLSDDM